MTCGLDQVLREEGQRESAQTSCQIYLSFPRTQRQAIGQDQVQANVLEECLVCCDVVQEGFLSVESVILPSTGCFLAQSTTDFSDFFTAADGFQMNHTNFLASFCGFAALDGAATCLMACTEFLNLAALISFFTNLLSGKDLLFVLETRSKISFQCSLASGSCCVMDYNSSGCKHSVGWAIS